MAERITTPFDAGSTAADVVADLDLSGRRALVTGASSGIGTEIVRALAGAGAEVTLAVRDTGAGKQVAGEIAAGTPHAALRVVHLDLSDPRSVRGLVDAWSGPLHILVGNAGVAFPPERYTAQGLETQFAVNHLGHHVLATGLHPALAAADGARLVTLSSVAHLAAPVDFDDLNFRKRPWNAALAYGQSKTATALFAVEAQRRWAADGITANTCHPGAVMSNLGRHLSPEDMAGMPDYDFRTAEQGAATPTLLATWPGLEGKGGRYFEDGNEALRHEPGQESGVADHALDPGAAERLWRVSDVIAERDGRAQE
ncbi:SDR family NAD(P)-dependent oxidoreductase [Streptomyces sp. NPDC005227]|uniref:SDR family NAD(P)-dependent oxidoreductase n=1 Tax=unclassified Streptomyces TaxID=2593676 RepID=UPI0036A3EB39